MCGIAGILREDVDLREQEQLLCQMSDSLRSRGPDDSGRYLEPGAALLHRRLAIIDPAGGRQPMRFGDLVIAYNGEIYNTAEVRHLLESAGYSFETACDTEVVLKAYHKWKAGCLEKLNGIFAFAVYDTRRGTLFAARDRIGVKPLFYCKKDDCLPLPAGSLPCCCSRRWSRWWIAAGWQRFLCWGLPAPRGTRCFGIWRSCLRPVT